LPEISVLTITGTDSHGELIAQPLKWDSRKKPPHIVVTESGRSRAAIIGDKVLAKLRKIDKHLYQALVIKVLPSEAPRVVLGVFIPTSDGGLIEPVSRKMKESFMVARGDTGGAERGELVSGVTLPGMPSVGMTYAKIEQRLGSLDSPRAASLIAASMHELPQRFSEEAMKEAEKAQPPSLSKDRVDLRDLPLVTIDGADARDFDDAVYAEPTKDGFMLVVAIADVAHYVAQDSALDKEAFQRGNSVYFPDRVIPMLPERLSNGLCSLNPNEDRYCLAVKLWIDTHGVTKKYEFMRGLMRSRARLTYEQVETIQHHHVIPSEAEGSSFSSKKDPSTTPATNAGFAQDDNVKNLWHAYAALAKERDNRGALALDLPEYKIEFDDKGHVAAIKQRERLEAHKLIECFMIAANVAAADFLLKKKSHGIYRVHETPAEEKLEDLRTLLKISGYGIAKGVVTAKHLNRVLKSSEGKIEQPLVHTAVLRAQMQAFYAAENLGHFGLGLQKYCHFTSPIRRYADLVVHRALAKVINDKKTKDNERKSTHLATIALHISETERKAMMAEREAMDRYKVAFMSKRIGHTFSGVVTGLNEYGLFVTLPENGVTGFIPVRNLGGDFFRYDKKEASFIGNRTRTRYQMGMSLFVRVADANPLTGSLIFELPSPYEGGNPVKHYKRRR